MHLKGLLLFCINLCILISCSKTFEKETITIFAAASTSDVITEIAAEYEAKTGIEIHINPASSGTLAKQISFGAEADIYFSASENWINYLESQNFIESKHVFAENKLVLISYKDSFIDPIDLSSNIPLAEMFSGRISLGDPNYVPAGKYAVEGLKSLNCYEPLRNRLLLTSDVRAALSVVELDEVDLGIVYITDALRSNKVKIISFFPESSYSPVLYFCALIKGSNSRGRNFYNYLMNDSQVQNHLSVYGFQFYGN